MLSVNPNLCNIIYAKLSNTSKGQKRMNSILAQFLMSSLTSPPPHLYHRPLARESNRLIMRHHQSRDVLGADMVEGEAAYFCAKSGVEFGEGFVQQEG